MIKDKIRKRFFKIFIVFGVLLIPLWINILIRLGNWVFQITGLNISAIGLENQDWFAFWGTYLGGIATVVAVWWTIDKTERQYLQTRDEQKRQNDEQKRQNDELKKDQERQRRLDVLPFILLQPRVILETSSLALMLGGLEEQKEEKLIKIDELKRVYEEYDASEITIVLAPKFELRVGGPTEEEMIRVKNQGHIKISLGRGMTTDRKASISFLRPFWFVNAGKEAAVNITFWLIVKSEKGEHRLHHVFFLMAKEKIKLNFLVDVQNEYLSSVFGEYQFIARYGDIYGNKYRQEYPIVFNEQKFILTLENVQLDDGN